MLFYIIRFKEIKKEVGTNWCGSIPIAIPISCLKTMLSIVEKNLFMSKDITLTKVF